MRVLILSDIHANLEALEACLDAAPEYDQVYNLGDIVGYGANPNEVTTRSRELGSIFVRGNHDKACSGVSDLSDFNPIAGLAALWTREKLTRRSSCSFCANCRTVQFRRWKMCNWCMDRRAMKMSTC